MSAPQVPGRPYHPRDFPPHLRATDAERELVADMVRAAAADGRLAIDEIDERVDLVFDAKTHGDLAQVVDDLVVYRAPRRTPVPLPAGSVPGRSYRSHRKILPAFLLCLFLGVFGVHRFYVGKFGSGTVMLLITLFTMGVGVVVTGVWAVIDLIVLATRSFRDGDHRPMHDWT